MKKEELIKGRKYQAHCDGSIFTFEKFDNDGNTCFLNEGQNHKVNEEGLIFFKSEYVLVNFTPIEEPEKDLNLSVGDSVYLGTVECKCIESSNHLDFPYTVSLTKGNFICIKKDGRLSKDTPPIFSREPYDLPEMVYEKPIQVGEMVFAWDYEHEIEDKYIIYGQYKGKSGDLKHIIGGKKSTWNFISKTSPIG